MNKVQPPHGAITAFRRVFGSAPRVFRAPGRINLIGEHTDYNDGFVMPAAIDFATWVAAEARTDRKIIAHSMAFNSMVEIDLDELNGKDGAPWKRLIKAVASALSKERTPIVGANLIIEGDVPMGAGLSSSASLEIALAVCLTALSNLPVSRNAIALAAQAAEIESTGARVGIMDQFVSMHGEAGKVLLLDCRSLEYQTSPLPNDLEFVICNTMIKHSIAGGEYNRRRAQCEEGVRVLRNVMPSILALRDVTLNQLENHKSGLSDVVYRRCRHVITENDRVLEMSKALKQGDEATIGRLMRASHESLRDDYEVSCPELDIMVDAAARHPALVGSRMTGGGFGGCTVNLVRRGRAQEFIEHVSTAYRNATGVIPDIFVTGTTDGAGEWKQD